MQHSNGVVSCNSFVNDVSRSNKRSSSGVTSFDDMRKMFLAASISASTSSMTIAVARGCKLMWSCSLACLCLTHSEIAQVPCFKRNLLFKLPWRVFLRLNTTWGPWLSSAIHEVFWGQQEFFLPCQGWKDWSSKPKVQAADTSSQVGIMHEMESFWLVLGGDALLYLRG